MRRFLNLLACLALLAVIAGSLSGALIYLQNSDHSAMCRRYSDALTLATNDRVSSAPIVGLTPTDTQAIQQLRSGYTQIAEQYQDSFVDGLNPGPETPNQQYDVAETRVHAAAMARQGC